MATLLLVDGSSYLYRAFHAMPDLRSPSGEPTGAVRGVLAMLRRLLAQYPGEYRACVFDAPGGTFRDDLYPDYKANRPSMPDELRAQVAPLRECIEAEGWPLIVHAGVEADDVIGTLTRQAVARGWEVVISTGDKDLTQLVQPGVRWVNTMSEETLDEAGVKAKFGVPPERIIDYLALIGDTVDNIPGVPKCGPKTAVKWLDAYGSLDGVIANAAAVGGKVGENLRAHLDFLPLARQLVTVDTEVELPMPVEALAPRAPDRAALVALYERLAFRSWLDELNGASASAGDGGPASADDAPVVGHSVSEGDATATGNAPGAHRDGYVCITTWAQFDDWLARIMQAPLVAFDTETTSLDPMAARLVGMSFAIAPGEAAYLPLAHIGPDAPEQLPQDETLARMAPWLSDPARLKVGQNLKYDAHVLANHGIALAGMAHDTLLQSYVLEADRPHDLDSLAQRHLGITTIAYTDVCGKGARQIGFDQVALEVATAYAAEDADITLRVHQVLWPRIEQTPSLARLYGEVELPLVPVLLAMERAGVNIDAALLARQSAELGERLVTLEAEVHELAGQPFNLASPKQLGEILFARMGLPVQKKTAKGAPSTDEEVLQKLAEDFPLPKRLLEHRGLAKLKSTYADKLPTMIRPDTGRVHTSFSQATAVTGRLASSEPNLQNIPIRTEAGRRIRAAFVAPDGYRLMSADYSQIELRIMAHLSADAGLLSAFKGGEDVHRATAAEVFGVAPEAVSSEQRRYAKVINFGLIYGMSAHGLAKNLGIERSAAQGWMDRYFARYPGVAAYMTRTRERAREQGYVETLFGRRLYLPEIRARQPARRQAAERAAINAPMQGTAADLIKLAMIAVQDWLETASLDARLVLQVHDELVLECAADAVDAVREGLIARMCGVAELAVPLVVEVGCAGNWDEAH